ncbi:MAG: hypothetical protein NC321_07100 [Clostridium sp.]|nr:hypothetical protein [Lachnoclostridium sp.]MCM1252571.1 hypothetical protein [Clostridium sp.]
MEKGRTHRVGTITCGLIFVVYGILFLLHIVMPQLNYRILFHLWPIALISLGVEILVSCTRKNQEERKVIYDFPAVLLIMLVILFVIIMTALDFGLGVSRGWYSEYYSDYGSSYAGGYSEEKSEALESAEFVENIESADESAAAELPDMTEMSEMTMPSEMVGLPAVEDVGSAFTDNWPESIRFDAEGVYAKLYEFSFVMEDAADIEIACVTEDGKLNMWIEDADGRQVFYEKNMQTDKYEAVIDKAGTYTVFLQMQYYYGSFIITPHN